MVTGVLANMAAQGVLLAQADMPNYGGGAGAGNAGAIMAVISGVGGLVLMAISLVVIIALWKVFTKAGQPGWAAIVPIYNCIVLTKIVGKPMWVAILLILPCTAFIGWIIAALALAKCFGKGTGFAIGLILFAPLFLLPLGFGSAQYQGPAA